MELLAELIAINSVSSEPVTGMLDAVCNRLDRPGARIERLPAGEPGKANLIVSIGPDAVDGSGLMLCGHMDVVPPGAGWSSDPFTLTVRGDRLVGRGTADMKGFIALAVARIARLDAARLRAPVVLLLTCDEEVGTRGARYLAEHWDATRVLPRGALIGEPTSLAVVSAHKGHLRLRFRFHGTPAHSGLPHLGVNAVEPAGRAIVALGALRRELEEERLPSSPRFPEVPFVVLNVAAVHGGSAFNMVPAECHVDVGLRTLPGGDSDLLARRVQQAILNAAAPAPVEFEHAGESPAMLTIPDSPLHAWLAGRRGQAGARSVSYASDGGWLSRLGFDAVLCGPGSIDVAHRPDEFVPAGEFMEAGTMIDDAIQHFAVHP